MQFRRGKPLFENISVKFRGNRYNLIANGSESPHFTGKPRRRPVSRRQRRPRSQRAHRRFAPHQFAFEIFNVLDTAVCQAR